MKLSCQGSGGMPWGCRAPGDGGMESVAVSLLPAVGISATGHPGPWLVDGGAPLGALLAWLSAVGDGHVGGDVGLASLSPSVRSVGRRPRGILVLGHGGRGSSPRSSPGLACWLLVIGASKALAGCCPRLPEGATGCPGPSPCSRAIPRVAAGSQEGVGLLGGHADQPWLR